MDVNGDGIICMKWTRSGKVLEKDNNAGTASHCPRGFFRATTLEERKLYCDSIKECGQLREVCLAAKWIYQDHYSDEGWDFGTCREQPTPVPG